MRLVLLSTITLLLISCETTSYEESSIETEQNSIDSISKEAPSSYIITYPKKKNECICSQNDSNPFTEFEFSNGSKIKLCEEFMGINFDTNQPVHCEFKLIDCVTPSKIYIESIGMDQYYMKQTQDTLNLILVKPLTVLGNCDNSSYYPIAKQRIYSQGDSLIVSDLIPFFDHIELDANLSVKFLQSIYLKKGFDLNWECLISSIELLSLNGNESAFETLMKLESILDQEADGAIAETLSDAQANIEWHMKK